MLSRVVFPPMHALSLGARSRQRYTVDDISPYLIVNGEPPTTVEFADVERGMFGGWRLEVRGLVAEPLSLGMEDLRALPASTQITKHHCIQGWSGVASWTGVNVDEVISRCQPLATARFAVFTSYQLDMAGRPFYETLDIGLMKHPQTLLAYEMNGAALTVAYGAPLRLRVETELGFKMVKWLRTIEFVDDYRTLGDGQGGSREDTMYYEQSVSI